MEIKSIEIPWWQRLRWKPSSRPEALVAEQNLLALGFDEQNTTTTDSNNIKSITSANTTIHATNTNKLEAIDVRIGPGKQDFLHTITGGTTTTTSATGGNTAPPLVYIPGYGAGVGFMFRAFEGLISGWKVHAVDPLGTGLSGRPPFTATTTQEAEDFFIDSLAKWRKAQGIDKMVLVGHSMGGYLSAVYALRYPEHVHHLILVCPAGVGKKPDDWQPPPRLRNPWSIRGMLFRAAMNMWDFGLTPGSLIRCSGPLGPSLVEGYARRRFKIGHHLSEEEVNAFQTYMYGVLAGRGSGEHALRHILEPFAFPRHALEDRLHDLKVPLTFIYGEHDWMDPHAAARVCNRLKSVRKKELAKSDLKVLTTKNAGHYPFIDQPGLFLHDLLEACREYLSVDARERVKAAAKKRPYAVDGVVNDGEELKEEMEYNAIVAETHIATDM